MQKIRIDFADPTYIPVIRAMQGDAFSRFVALSLYYDGVPYTPPEGATYQIGYKLRGGLEGAYDTISLQGGSTRPACSAEENVVTMELAEILTIDGNVGKISLLIQGNDGFRLHTWGMTYFCGAIPALSSSDPSLSALEELIGSSIDTIANSAKEAKDAADRAEKSADRAENSEPAGAAERAEAAEKEATKQAEAAKENANTVEQLKQDVNTYLQEVIKQAGIATSAKDEATAQASNANNAKTEAEVSAKRAEEAAASVETDALIAKITPPGTIIWFSGEEPPEGYLACNGAEVNRESYSKLFAVIGTKFGQGDGSTTFNLPDLRGSL